MIDALAQFQLHARAAWRFRWLAIAAAWAVAVAGWGIVISLPSSYESQARVYVDAETVLKPLLAGLAVNSDVTNRVNMMSTVMLSRPNLQKVARDTDLYLRAESPEQYEALINSLSKRITLTPAVRDGTYTISYIDYDRRMAERVVHTLLNTFVEDTLGIKRADTTGAQRFLQDELHEYEKRLAEAEERLADFKKKHLGLMPGEEGDYYTRLQSGMTRLEKLRSDFRIATERRNALLSQLEGEEPVFGLDPDAQRKQSYSPLDTKIAEHNARLDTLLLQYTDKHPDVIALRQTIADLEQQRAAEEMRRPPAARQGGGALNQNPVYQNMKISLSRTEVELAQLRSQIGTQEREVAQLKSKVDTIPEVEAQLARLNRDYEVNRTQYTAVLQRLESARLSERAEESTEELKFRIIEPPSTPLKPVAPNRPLLLSFVLLIATAVGVGFAMLINQLRPVFSSRQALKAITQLPVLGYISLIRRPGEADPLLQRPAVAWSASAMLLVAYASVLVYAAFVVDVAS